MITEFAAALNKELRKDMNDYADALANGACRSFEEYQHLCGKIQGLSRAEEHLKVLLKKVSDDE